MRKRFILSVILMMGVCGKMHASATDDLKDVSVDTLAKELINLLGDRGIYSVRDFNKFNKIVEFGYYPPGVIEAAIMRLKEKIKLKESKLKGSPESEKLITLLNKIKSELSPKKIEELVEQKELLGAEKLLKKHLKDFYHTKWHAGDTEAIKDRSVEKKDITEYYPIIARQTIEDFHNHLMQSDINKGPEIRQQVQLMEILISSEILRDSKSQSITDYVLENDSSKKRLHDILNDWIIGSLRDYPEMKEFMTVYIRVLRENGDADWADELESLLEID